ncbi:MAG: BACON domain-containing protein, partial [Synergistaceae bacterium]|nr:BACON domain-containing protein [Synergistaceae bacterium]
RSVFTTVILAVSILFAAMISGGCGGSSSDVVYINDNTEEGDPNGPDYYTSEVAEKLIARSDVHDLAEYVKDTSQTIKKGEVLLYYPENGEDIKAYGSYWPRLSEALEAGAIISIVDIEAGEIDEITGKLSLNVPSYLPDNATEAEKAELVDFYAFAARADGVDSQDSAVVNYYTFYGTDLHKVPSMDIYLYSGDEAAAFEPGECEELQVDGEYYYIASEDRIVSEDPDPVLPYNHVDDTVQDFLSWVRELDSMDSVIELEDRIDSESVSASAFTAAAAKVNDSLPAVQAKINLVQIHSPRTFYFTKAIAGRYTYTRGEWKRKTFMDFDIVPVHNFTDGADYYFIQLTGGSDSQEQYDHASLMYAWDDYYQKNRKIFTHGGRRDNGAKITDGSLYQDFILGYDYILGYDAYFKSGNNIVGSVINSSPVGTVTGDAANNLTAATFKVEGRSFSGGTASKSENKAGVPLKMKTGFTTNGSTNGFTWKGVDGKPKMIPSPYDSDVKYSYWKTNHKIINKCSTQKAGWQWEFPRPADGSRAADATWLVDTERAVVRLRNEFVIKVTKEEWKKYPDLKLIVDFYSKEGATEGGGNFFGIGNAGRRDYSFDWDKKGNECTLPRPPHIAADKTKIVAYKYEENQGTLICSEEDWTATANATWIHMKTLDKEATATKTTTEEGFEMLIGKPGNREEYISLTLDPVTDGETRSGKITLKSSDGEFCIVEITQIGESRR